MLEPVAAHDNPRRVPFATTRPTFQLRANNFVKKLSNFTTKLNLRGDKSKGAQDRNGGTIYRRHSMDMMPRKPFLSQPVLALSMGLPGDETEQTPSPGSSSFGRSTPAASIDSARRTSAREPRLQLATADDMYLPGHSSARAAPPNATPPGGSASAEASHPPPRWVETVGNAPNILVSEPESLKPPVKRRPVSESGLTAASKKVEKALPPLGVIGEGSESSNTLSTTIATSSAAASESTSSSTGITKRAATLAKPVTPNRPVHPRLASLPPLSTIHLMETSDQRARLSPTIIVRSPPLPLFNLPPMPPPTPRASTSGPMPVSRLRSMPVLPMEGPDDRQTGHGDWDDDDMEMDDMDEEDDMEEPSRGVRHSMGSDDESAETDTSTSRSGHSQSAARPNLPSIDTSALNSGSFLGKFGPGHEVTSSSLSQPGASSIHQANAAVAGRESERDGSATPTPGQRPDYFSDGPQAPPTSLASPRTPRAESSLQTPLTARFPRPETRSTLPPLRNSLVLPSPLPPMSSSRPSLYHQASKSMTDLATPSKDSGIGGHRGSRAFSGVDINQKGKGKDPETVSHLNAPQATSKSNVVNASATAPAISQNAFLQPGSPLRRQRSMPTFTASGPPPPYPSFLPELAKRQPAPRDEEGMERLPCYTNDIYLAAIMPRKMEFVAPGIQAKDRKWRRVLCVLEGTACSFYACAPSAVGVGVLGKWWERKVGVGDVSLAGGSFGGPSAGTAGDAAREPTRPKWEQEEDPASPDTPSTDAPAPRKRHIAAGLLHPGHARSSSSSSAGSRPSSPFRAHRPSLQLSRHASQMSSSSGGTSVMGGSTSPSTEDSSTTAPSSTCQASSSARSPTQHFRTHSRSASLQGTAGGSNSLWAMPSPKDLLREYTLQNAESGLASDYLKRRNVIRVRMEGEQFLLQAVDIAAVVEWIEALQAATNIALDLDLRPMPRGPIFPRRRRRRRIRVPGESEEA